MENKNMSVSVSSHNSGINSDVCKNSRTQEEIELFISSMLFDTELVSVHKCIGIYKDNVFTLKPYFVPFLYRQRGNYLDAKFSSLEEAMAAVEQFL